MVRLFFVFRRILAPASLVGSTEKGPEPSVWVFDTIGQALVSDFVFVFAINANTRLARDQTEGSKPVFHFTAST